MYPPKPSPGSRIAVISPSRGLPAIFPDVYELGLRRLRGFGLEPVEYPTTRVLDAPPADRARDVQAAFADPSIAAVLSTIGGDDQITILRHLDPEVLRANPKPFFGYSDNTVLLNYLYGLGIIGYHGGSVLVQLGRAGSLHPLTRDSLSAALFTSGWFDLTSSPDYSDEPVDWLEPDYETQTQSMFPSPAGWQWHGPGGAVEGRLWGGNIEVLTWLLATDRVAPPPPGAIFMTETSEDMPPAIEVYYMLRNLGERGWLSDFKAILMGRAKCWDRVNPLLPHEKRVYADDQRAAVLRAASEYAPDAVLVLDLDIGHTDPQQILPYGGEVRIDPAAGRISVRY